MKRFLFALLFIFIFHSGKAQTKKVLFEEICGAHCGNCPSGSWIVDSLTKKHIGLIGVALHSYGSHDAMYFPQLDTINALINVTGGAPYGEIDRMQFPAMIPHFMLFNFIDIYDSLVQVRLAAPPSLASTINPTWNSLTRNISAQVDINILANLVQGDYRVSLYVVEDSVTGTGIGYDQSNFYNTSPPGNPFFGLGNPIAGFIHRHVVRATLPSSLGQQGVLPSLPLAGQSFSTVINYTLPVSVNENKTSLVAFVYRYSTSASNYEVLNSDDVKLIAQPSGINYLKDDSNIIDVFPNPANAIITIAFSEAENITVINMPGEVVIQKNVSSNKAGIETLNISELSPGIYFVKTGNKVRKFVISPGR